MIAKVSIIVPVYKAEKYLQQCIDSILNQTYQNLEIILVDDGSPDGSGKICDDYSQKDDRIIVVHKKNAGVSAARNTGLELASGKYICFIDSDDWVSKNYCEVLCSKANDTRLVVSSYLMEEKSERAIIRLGDRDAILSYKQFYSLRNLRNMVWNKLYIADIIRINQLRFNTELCWGEDLLFNLKYIRYINDMQIINSPLYHYRRFGEESLDNKYHENLYAYFKLVHKELFAGISSQENHEIEMRYYYTTYFNYLLRATSNTFHAQCKKSFFEKIAFNNEIMKSEDFINCLKYADLSSINRFYVYLLKQRNYFWIYLANSLLSLCNSWRSLYFKKQKNEYV